MPVIINGTTGLSGVSTVNLANGSVTQNILANGVAGTGPAFSAYQSSAQGVAVNTWTKVILQTEEFDTANCFDNSSTYRFTPNVAGYYQVSGGINVATNVCVMYLQIYKNGAGVKLLANTGSATVGGASGSSLIYLNGSTDFVELYCYLSVGQSLGAGLQSTFFQGVLARAA